MEPTTDRDQHSSIVHTGVWLPEYEWLHALFRNRDNASPKFRLPDLLSACVSLALANTDTQQQLVELVVTQEPGRGKRARRSCDIFAKQFAQVMEAYRAPWNRFPNPRFEINHVTSGCVTVVMAWPDGAAQVLAQARVNFLERARAGIVGSEFMVPKLDEQVPSRRESAN